MPTSTRFMLPPLFPNEPAQVSLKAVPDNTLSPIIVSENPQRFRSFAAVHSSFWVLGAVVLTIFGLVAFLAIGIVTSSPTTASISGSTYANGGDFGNVYGAWTDLPPSQFVDESTVFNAQSLQNKLAAIIERYPNHEFGVVVAPVGDGEQVRIQDDRVFTGASTTKVLTAAAVLASVDSGKLRLDQLAYNLYPTPSPTPTNDEKKEDTVADNKPASKPSSTPTPTPTPTPEPIPVTIQQALQSMINRSNNTAWENLIRLIGPKNLKQFALDLGMRDYGVADNTTSSRDMALLLHKIYSDQLLSQESKQLLLSYMQHTNEERMIPAAMTQSGEVYHKYGWLGGSLHDVAVVDNLSKPVIVVLMSEGKSGYAERTQVIRELAAAVEQELLADRN